MSDGPVRRTGESVTEATRKAFVEYGYVDVSTTGTADGSEKNRSPLRYRCATEKAFGAAVRYAPARFEHPFGVDGASAAGGGE